MTTTLTHRALLETEKGMDYHDAIHVLRRDAMSLCELAASAFTTHPHLEQLVKTAADHTYNAADGFATDVAHAVRAVRELTLALVAAELLDGFGVTLLAEHRARVTETMIALATDSRCENSAAFITAIGLMV